MAYTNPSYYAEIKKKIESPTNYKNKARCVSSSVVSGPSCALAYSESIIVSQMLEGNCLVLSLEVKEGFLERVAKESRMRMKPTPEVVGGFRDRK